MPSKGGAERVVEAIVSRSIRKNISPTIYCDKSYTPSHYSLTGVKLIRLPTVPGKYLRSTSLFLFSAIHAVCFSNYDLIHLHNMESAFILPLLKLKYHVIGTCHGSAYWRNKWGRIARFIMRLLDYPFIKMSNIVTSVSKKDSDNFSKKYNKQVEFIPNGVSRKNIINHKESKKILQSLNMLEGDYFLFVAGRIEPTKGAHLAIEAINNQKGNTKLIILGDFKQDKNYTNYLRKISGANILFKNLIKDASTVFGLMKKSIAVIFPSEFEAMSMVLLEASSLGVTVICSDIEENQYVLGEKGLYFSNGDSKSLGLMIQNVLMNKKSLQKISEDIQERVLLNFSWDRIINDYILIYNEVLKK